MNELRKIQVRVPKWAIPKWWTIAYKRVPEVTKEFAELLEIRPDEKFNKVIGGYVHSVITEGVMPPAEIATTILNLANDFVNGNEMVIRTGDYIAIQKHLRGIK